jgi:D-alanyl-D-alanine carboxypeptidase/D-alanyl-D-alanine-endopeptidase (penicillin-binding protein 4)
MTRTTRPAVPLAAAARKRRRAALLCFLLICAPIAQAGLEEQLRQRVAAYTAASKARVAVSVVDLPSGRDLWSLRAREKMIPASNQKLVTSILALKRLGADFKFNTSVFLYKGDLCLSGDADPTLGDPVLAQKKQATIYEELDRWSRQVQEKLSPPAFENLVTYANPPAEGGWQHPDWSKADKARWYGAPVAALNFNNNCYDVTFQVRGAKVFPRVSPASRSIKVVDQTRKGTRQIWLLRPADDESQVLLKGKVARSSDEPISAPAKHPPLLLARVLADRLVRAEVRMTGRFVHKTVPKEPLEGARLLAQTETPIATVVSRANKRSLNMAAECLLLRAGNGRWQRSAEILSQTMTREFRVPASQFVLRDGSGLSRKNRISAKAMTDLLSNIIDSPSGKVLLESLPISGTDGSLDDRMEGEKYKARVRAKTGYIYKVCCLSGYVLDAKGRPALAFSILANDVPGGKAYVAKEMQDDLCRRMVDFLDGR